MKRQMTIKSQVIKTTEMTSDTKKFGNDNNEVMKIGSKMTVGIIATMTCLVTDTMMYIVLDIRVTADS